MKNIIVTIILSLGFLSATFADSPVVPESPINWVTPDARLKEDPFLQSVLCEKINGGELRLQTQYPKAVFRYTTLWADTNMVNLVVDLLSQFGKVSNYNFAYSWMSNGDAGPSASVQLHLLRVRILDTLTFDGGPSYTFVSGDEAKYHLIGVGLSLLWQKPTRIEKSLRSWRAEGNLPFNFSEATLYLSGGVKPDNLKDYGITIGVGGIKF